jgi:hypothetical protein
MKRFKARGIIAGSTSVVGVATLVSVLGAGVKWGSFSQVVEFFACGVKWLG